MNCFGVEFKKSIVNLISNPSKLGEDFFFTAGCLSRIIKTDVKSLSHVPGKYRTRFFCVVANRDDVIEGVVEKLIDTFGKRTGQVNPDSLHHTNCFGMDV